MQMTIDLAPIGREDLPQLLSWRNDWRIIDWTRQSDLLNEVEHAEWFERQARDPAIRMYKLIHQGPGKTTDVGVCGLTSIDYRNSRAEFSLYIAPPFQGQKLGKLALAVLLNHAFLNIGVNLVYGETFDGNPAAKTFEALGMRKEGTRRQFYWKNGRRIDAHLYSITREDWHVLQTRPPDGAAAPASECCERDSGSDLPAPTPLKTKRKAKSATRAAPGAPDDASPPEDPRAA